MRKLLCCVPMIMLLLAGCGPAGVSEAEELALAIRGEYLEMTSGTAQLTVTADYGRRVYRYEMTALWEGEETELTLTAPETVAGRWPGPTGRTASWSTAGWRWRQGRWTARA